MISVAGITSQDGTARVPVDYGESCGKLITCQNMTRTDTVTFKVKDNWCVASEWF